MNNYKDSHKQAKADPIRARRNTSTLITRARVNNDIKLTLGYKRMSLKELYVLNNRLAKERWLRSTSPDTSRWIQKTLVCRHKTSLHNLERAGEDIRQQGARFKKPDRKGERETPIQNPTQLKIHFKVPGRQSTR